ncbi:MAG: extracellular solute-binding protein [Desulfotomaculum sp.]|nr:extracellular solute-binding protein [Desulfotomaculum sp.]
MLKKKNFVFLLVMVFSLAILVACGDQTTTVAPEEQAKEIITIKAQTAGAETRRVDNLVAAAEKLNKELVAEGKNIVVEVETSIFDGGWADYYRQFKLAFRAQKEPDIYAVGHPNIGWLASGGYILPLCQLKEAAAYQDIFPVLWEAVTWNDQIWGAPLDLEVRPVFFRVDVLQKLGWSEAEIKNLPEKVRAGAFTVEDMTQLGKEAQAAGLVEWGILHRPTDGPEFHMMAKNFGAQLYDPAQDKLIFDKPAILKTLQYLHGLTQNEKVTPEAITTMEWKQVHQMMIDGQALFWYGGIWNVFNYVAQGMPFDEVMDKFDFMLVPAAEKGGNPITLSHPFVYTVSAQTEHPELVTRLLELVAAPEFQAANVETGHLPITKSGIKHERVQADPFLSTVTYMIEYTTFQPNHPDFVSYGGAFYKAIQAVQLGRKTPAEALDAMEAQIKSDIGDNIIIKEG